MPRKDGQRATVDVEARCDVSLVRSFMAKVRIEDGGCWTWTAGRYPTNGYGYFRNRKAHRVAYSLFVGPLDPELTVDHLCHTADLDCPGGLCPHRLCVRPDHLEQVTREENYRRGRLGAGMLKGDARWDRTA